MDLQHDLESLPPKSVYREILADLMNADQKVRDAGSRRLRDLRKPATYAEAHATTWENSEEEALALLKLAVTLPLPPPKFDWEDAVHDLIFQMIYSPYPSLVGPVRDAYARLSDRAKCAALSLFGASGTREAAEAFIASIRDHGWPRGGVYERVYSELPKLAGHADVLFPKLIELAGPNIGGVTNVLLAGIADGKIDRAKVDLEPIAPLAVKQLGTVLKAAAKHQRPSGIAWRFAEMYFGHRQQAGAWLDVAGYLKSPALTPLLEGALALLDPRLKAFAASALLRRGAEPANVALAEAAACHETRSLVFGLLQGLNRLDLFPAKHRTWDAFAAADMVNWLMYPAELGREPDELEQMAVFVSDEKNERALYVWRFRADDGLWYAGTSGPYLRKGDPAPISGNLTFSCFDEWSKAGPEEHATAVLETLQEWRKEWDKAATKQ